MARGRGARCEACRPRRSPSCWRPISAPSARTTRAGPHRTRVRRRSRRRSCAAGPDRALRGNAESARIDRRARARCAAQHRRHGRLCRAQRLSAAKERRGLVLIDPPFEAPDEADKGREGARARDPQMADRDLRRVAADPRSRRRPLSQLCRRARRAEHLAAELDVGLGRSARTGRSRSRAPGFSSSTRRTR